MISPEAIAEFRVLLGGDAVETHAPFSVDGVGIGVTLRPADGEVLARSLALLGRLGLSALLRGGGSRLLEANLPRRADVILSTEHLRGVEDFVPAEGICRVRAGTPLTELREVVSAEGWELPLDPPGSRATVGGTIAAAAVGPRAHAFGPPRDAVLGLDVALATGERARCGGRVVKNVMGYDLNKLYTGSFGTLAVIEAAWLRLRPRPKRVRCFEVSVADAAEAWRGALTAARRGSTRAAALASPGSVGDGVAAAHRISLEFAGDPAAVDADANWLEHHLAGREVPEDAIERVRAQQVELAGPGGLRFRIAVLPSKAAELLGALRAGGAATLAYPGLPLVYAGFALPASEAEGVAARAFAKVAETAASAGATWVCEEAPTWAKRGREMLGDVGALLPILANLKQRFDPAGVLNPGRFCGGL